MKPEHFKLLSDKDFRLNNLYWITDKEGKPQRFRMTPEQREYFEGIHTRNIILKARQLGFTTEVCIIQLDAALFESAKCALIAHTLNDAKRLFREKVKYAYDRLPAEIRAANPASNDSAGELVFRKGGSLYVSTSFRGGTLRFLHVSEFGKICAKFPDKAREIVTGAFEAVSSDCFTTIESTAEGRASYFFDYCQTAEKAQLQGKALSNLDWKFFFFSWWKNPLYSIDPVEPLPQRLDDYFDDIEQKHGVILNDRQKAWYYAKEKTLGDDMKREYPSIPAEAFEQSVEGAYYAKQFRWLYTNKRVGELPDNSHQLVHTFWDIGVGDSTAIWFIREVGDEFHVIDYYENSGEGLRHYMKVLKDRGYEYGDHWAPHDIDNREFAGDGKSRRQIAAEGFEIDGQVYSIRFKVAPKLGVDTGIDSVREILPKCAFDASKCEQGISHLEGYLLSSLIDVGGRTVTWVADAGASFINSANLNGRIFRRGIRNNNVMQHGTLDGACSFSVSANRGAEAPAQVLGVISPDQIATYMDRDSVGLHAENYAPAILATTSTGTYTANSVTFGTALTADQVKKLRVGMIIDTKHTPTKYSGIVTGWAANGTSITVEGWYLVDGSSASHSKVTPANGTGVNINPFTKAWAMNANVFIDTNSHAVAAVGLELGVSNEKFDYDPVTDTWHTWCYDAITLGSKRCETAYMQRGYYYKGYESRGATGYGFTGKNANGIWPSVAMYHSQANSDFQVLVQPDIYANKTSFAVKKDGSVEMGRTDAAATVTLDFHSSGNEIDYDTRISSTGGTATNGGGTITLAATSINMSPGYIVEFNSFRPSTDGTKTLGLPQYRFSIVYASTGTINTSDVTTKTFLDIERAEKDAAGEIKGMMRKFQFNDAISEKGADKARYHFGVGAQYVRDVLVKHGLDPDMYAFLCYDKWEDEYEDIYEDVEEEREVAGKADEPVIINGEQVGTRRVDITYTAKVKEQRATGAKRLVREAGELYGIRYDELICFIMSAM